MKEEELALLKSMFAQTHAQMSGEINVMFVEYESTNVLQLLRLSKKMTNCQQNKHGLDRLEMYPPLFLVTRLLSWVKSTLFLPLLSGQLTRVRFTMVN